MRGEDRSPAAGHFPGRGWSGRAGSFRLVPRVRVWQLGRVTLSPAPRLALQRSIVFWSGLLVLAFLGCAWRDSMDWLRLVKKPYFWVSSGYGGLSCGFEDAGSPGFSCESNPLPRPELLRVFEEPFFIRGGGPLPDLAGDGETRLREQSLAFASYLSPDCWDLFIPYWLMLAVVLPLWLGLLLWRILRQRHRSS